MASCEICGMPLRRMDEQYIQIPGTKAPHCVCNRCKTCMTILTGETNNMGLFEACADQIFLHLENGDIQGELKTYIEQVMSSVDEKRTGIERRAGDRTSWEAWHKESAAKRAEGLRNFKTTTGYQFDGYKVVDYKEVVSGEIVIGGGMFKEIAASASDVFGVRAGGFEENLSNAKRTALNIAKENAMKIGANALLGVDFDITTVGNSLMVVSASGTAVIIEEQE